MRPAPLRSADRLADGTTAPPGLDESWAPRSWYPGALARCALRPAVPPGAPPHSRLASGWQWRVQRPGSTGSPRPGKTPAAAVHRVRADTPLTAGSRDRSGGTFPPGAPELPHSLL